MELPRILSVVALALSVHVHELAGQTLGVFTTTGNMAAPRAAHTATLLPNGTVLITGGSSVSDMNARSLSTAELYDPASESFRPTGAMSIPRQQHTATLLGDGRVLVTGGYGSVQSGQFAELTATAEIYDPGNGTFSPAGVMSKARSFHAATMLSNGRVLISGGRGGDASAELYDAATGAFTPTGSMTVSREQHKTVLLPDGTVLIVPGGDGSSLTAEIYETARGVFTRTDWDERYSIAATADLLPSGKVLVSSNAEECDVFLHFALLYDPARTVFERTGDMPSGICRPVGTQLADGNVFLTGGWFDSAIISQTYDSKFEAFSRSANLITGRREHTSTLLNDGSVLLVGGMFWNGPPLSPSASCCTPLASAEVYRPLTVPRRPELYTSSGGRQGAILHAGSARLVSSTDPAEPGEVVEIYGAGLLDRGAITPQLSIGGKVAEVLWFGNAPAYQSLAQINARVPSGVASGNATVRFSYLGRHSNDVSMAVR
jgi:hypothetical protein